jgi:hypothetical protein
VNTTPCVLLTGAPRAGTTLVCELLNRLADARALDEPLSMLDFGKNVAMDGDAVDADRLCREIARFADDQRHSILDRGTALSKHVAGKVSGSLRVRETRDDTGSRPSRVESGVIRVHRPQTADFTLVIKEPVMFTAMLSSIRPHFPVFAVVRNPLAVLGSWESMPWRTLRVGQLGIPTKLAPEIHRRLEHLSDPLERRIEMLVWHFESFTALLPRERVIRYEDVIASGGSALSGIVASAAGLNIELEARDGATIYDLAHLRLAGSKLLERDDAPWELYYPGGVEDLLESLPEQRWED